MLRCIDASLDAGIVAEIDGRLKEVEASENVRILLAIESGSRAWGFPSPDSDYDCRFFYSRPLTSYLALLPGRDVIETPLTAVFDVNGWDIAKAVKLLLKGNAVVVEWLTSPLVYRGDADFRERFLALAARVVDRGAIAHHYYHLALAQRRRWIDPNVGEGALKKVFYALRPAMALCWMRAHPKLVVAPMRLQDLMAGVSLPAGLREDIAALLEKKGRTRELGRGAAPRSLVKFIDKELNRFAAAPPEKAELSQDRISDAQRFFQTEIGLA